ncbi:ATP-grasp domain-containing protein [Euzebya tangerina]|uniref:carboxylate--amine ligase n=1 Tax=Euzebya tangerina TaxID=591198 RepID=UPI0013C2A00B|nr:ATP-grasp domain-containing protein [Euzebya tangerina]
MRRRVLLTDGVIRRTLAATRDLDRNGIATTVAESTRMNISFFSRHCDRRLLHPSVRTDPDGFLEVLEHHLARNHHDCLIPMEQDTLDLILDSRDRVEAHTVLPWPDAATYSVFRDKAQTIALAERIGVPHPRTVQPSSPARVSAETAHLRMPVVIKPRRNWASRGLRWTADRAELPALYAEVHSRYTDPLVQEMIPPGPQFHVGALRSASGRFIATTAMHELRHYPATFGVGVSTVQRSVDRPDLVDLTCQLLDAVDWVGVAGVDFLIDPRDGTPVLMEVNPRFWGPLQAPIHAGVSFPTLLVDLVTGREPTVLPTPRTGVVTRCLLPYDLLHFVTNPDRLQMDPSFFHHDANTHFDVLSHRDPLPALGFALTLLRYGLDPDAWRFLAHSETVSRSLGRLRRRAVHDRETAGHETAGHGAAA